MQISLSSITKMFAYVFLGLCFLFVVLLFFAGSNWGVRTATHFAQTYVDGLKVSDINGSLYSQLEVEQISFAPENANIAVDVSNLKIDIGLSCLLDMALCLEDVEVDRLDVVLLPAGDQALAETSSQNIITLPLPVSVTSLRLNYFELSQAAVANADVDNNRQQTDNEPDTQTLLAISSLQASEFSALEEFSLNSLSVEQVLAFQTEPLNDAPVNSNTTESSFLVRLDEMLSAPPEISIPEVFIPLNANVNDIRLKQVCWNVEQSINRSSVDKAFNPQSCVGIEFTSLNIDEQVLQVELEAILNDVLAQAGIQAQMASLETQIDFADRFDHALNIALGHSEKSEQIKLTSEGNIETMRVSLTNTPDTAIATIQYKGDLQQNALPLELAIAVDDISQIEPWLTQDARQTFPVIIDAFDASISGDWEDYRASAMLNLNAKALKGISAAEGVSIIEFKGVASAGKKRLAIETLNSQGAIGRADISGELELRTLDAQEQANSASNTLALISRLNVVAENIDLSALQAKESSLSSDLSGKLMLRHTLTEDWMRGALKCNDIKGSLMKRDLGIECDLSVNKAGVINISEFSFIQGVNSITTNGQLTLARTDFAELSVEEILNTRGDLSLSADIPELSQLLAQFTNSDAAGNATSLQDAAIENSQDGQTGDDAKENASVESVSRAGSLQLNASMTGSLIKPVLDISAELEAFTFNEFELETLNVQMSVDGKNDYRSDLSLDLKQGLLGNFVVKSASVEADGVLDEHQVSLVLVGEEFSTQQRFSGGFIKVPSASSDKASDAFSLWQGKWESSSIKMPFLSMQLAEPTDIYANIQDQNYRLADFCFEFQNEGNSLCLKGADYEDGEASALAELVYDLAAPARHYYPELIFPETHLPLNSRAFIDFASNGLNARVYNTIIGGEVETENHLLALTAIVANLTFENDVLSTAIYAGTKQTGTLGLQSSINILPEEREHQGRVRISDFDLNVFQRFIPSIESILGKVNADIGFAGELVEPQLSGTLSINNGELILDAYTYPLTNFYHNMQFDGMSAEMQGGFNLGEGKGSYEAALDLANGFSIDGNIKGNDLQFAFKESTAQVSPDLNFDLSPDALTLKGDVGIPKAQIKIEELPESAKTPSSDTIIIGAEPPEPVVPVALDIDLNILIDKEERGFVQVDALGLEATLAGNLDLQVIQKRSTSDDSLQPMRTLLNGQVNVLDGSYEAYGQMLVVQSGRIFFNGEPSLPQFNIRAIRNPLNIENDVTAGIHITGNPVVPRVELFSNPPMTQARQLSYLLQGRDVTGGDFGSGDSNSTALVNLLVGYGVGRSDNRISQVGRTFGLDSLNLQTAGAGDNTQVQITGRLTEDIQITYGIGVFSNATEVVLKYQLMPKLFIEATGGGADSAIDLFYQFTRRDDTQKD
uniref:translocation/assembly module TamB domain-containing protein n=1 Tax=Ningiella ruwaisensis TaxID=2364274 RepID=UPI00109F5FB7|nr:translocation/assembly module TamB domain-containing protein [Ningiella ruwaisensis]